MVFLSVVITKFQNALFSKIETLCNFSLFRADLYIIIVHLANETNVNYKKYNFPFIEIFEFYAVNVSNSTNYNTFF